MWGNYSSFFSRNAAMLAQVSVHIHRFQISLQKFKKTTLGYFYYLGPREAVDEEPYFKNHVRLSL